MTRLLLFILIGYVAFLFLRRKEIAEKPAEKPTGSETFQDPVCGVYVSEEEAVVGRIDDRRIHFCSMACLEKFRDGLEHKNEKGRTEQ